MKNSKSKSIGGRVFLTLIAAILLCVVLFAMISSVYRDAEAIGYENLHLNTKHFKDDIQLQMISDKENLITMARFAGKLYSGGEDIHILLNSFKPIGLIKEIGILWPDNSFVTKMGTIYDSPFLFEEECEKGEYISGREFDIISPEREIIRSAVPITVDNKTVGMLYGIIDLSVFRERYESLAQSMEAQLLVVKRSTGNILVNTRTKELGNISMLNGREYHGNYSYQLLKHDIDHGISGFTSFISSYTGETLYMHYAPTTISDWQILFAEPEYIVFKEARKTSGMIIFVFASILAIMVAYLSIIFSQEHKASKLSLCASTIRKLLLDINKRAENFSKALSLMVSFSKARSAFFLDTDGEEYYCVSPKYESIALSSSEKKYFLSTLLTYAQKKRKDDDIYVNVTHLFTNSKLKNKNPEFYNFLKKHKIFRVSFAGVANNKKHLCLIGVLNAKRFSGSRELLGDIAVCFSISIYNKKHLSRTESIAQTDALTGLYNRMAYKKAVAKFDERMDENFACIYIDVNELHVMNNRLGHSAGDGMLIYIADVLRECFDMHPVYRIGGDEFLVFTQGVPENEIDKKIGYACNKIEEKNYHISVGKHFVPKNTDTENVVIEAEKKMYEAKARYYQNKNALAGFDATSPRFVEHIETGIPEIDMLLKVLGQSRFAAIYRVSLKNDKAVPILLPSHMKKYDNGQSRFSQMYTSYVHDLGDPDCHRQLLSLINYDILAKQLSNGLTPSITYSNLNRNRFKLSIYSVSALADEAQETIWIFEQIS